MAASQLNCDVLVIGGGAAGVAAAIAAGRLGAKTILLERYGFLGGLATSAQVGTICGLYLRDPAGTQATPVANGFPIEFASRLRHAGTSQPVVRGSWTLGAAIRTAGFCAGRRTRMGGRNQKCAFDFALYGR